MAPSTSNAEEKKTTEKGKTAKKGKTAEEKKATGRPYLYFGYMISDKWLLKYAVRKKLCPNLTPQAIKENGIDVKEVDVVGSHISAAMVDILARADIVFSSRFGTVLASPGNSACCIVLATNEPRDGLPVPPPEKYARLKEILHTTEEPNWYRALS